MAPHGLSMAATVGHCMVSKPHTHHPSNVLFDDLGEVETDPISIWAGLREGRTVHLACEGCGRKLAVSVSVQAN